MGRQQIIIIISVLGDRKGRNLQKKLKINHLFHQNQKNVRKSIRRHTFILAVKRDVPIRLRKEGFVSDMVPKLRYAVMKDVIQI